jgi:glutamyl-tRNA reductase
MSNQQILFAFGLNHKTSAVDVREKLYIQESEIPDLLTQLKRYLPECLIISTCNRTEIYGVCDPADFDPDLYKDLVIDFKNARGVVKREHFFTSVSCAACQQLFNVAASIDSKIIGDSQILSQLRDAYSLAKTHGSTGKILNQLSQRALKIGKKTFTQTSIHKGAVSISIAAVGLAVETYGSIAGKSVLVIGAGETARLTAEALINKRVGRIVMTNRTRSHAEQMLESLAKTYSFTGEIIEFEHFKEHLRVTDIIISSTSSPEPIIRKDDLAANDNRILLIDIAVPRDVDPAVAENQRVILKNIDDLHSIIDSNYERRMKDLPRVKKLVMNEMADFLMWYYSLPLMPSMEKTQSKPNSATRSEMLKIKEFLGKNVSEFHKLAMQQTGDVKTDLANHARLIDKLQIMKSQAFEGSTA